jgi:multicomponent Na+:H+ antiporter subunit B
MTGNMIILVLLLLLMTVGSVIAIVAKSLTSSIVSMGTAGLILSIIFLLLGAPDIAIVQIFVEIVALIVLLSIIHRESSADMSSSGLYGGIVLIIFAVFMFVFMLNYSTMFRPFGSPFMTMGKEYLGYSPGRLNTANVVTATVMDFRGYDTLGEATIIFTAIIGVLVLLRPRGRIDE